uniref:Uncharacterized protein n=1 Tax=Rhodnius prolixus TaxID=13249 RepID=T1HUT3_RHOPR
MEPYNILAFFKTLRSLWDTELDSVQSELKDLKNTRILEILKKQTTLGTITLWFRLYQPKEPRSLMILCSRDSSMDSSMMPHRGNIKTPSFIDQS